MSRERREHEGELETSDQQRSRRPRRFHVIFLNDDYTTMEFVVEVLETVFHHPPAAAVQLMLEVHRKGQAIVGTYPRDIAESKAEQTVRLARAEGHPLRCTVQRA